MKREFNILKAIGIISVVFGHIPNGLVFFQPYSYHMALFIFISGYFYKSDSEKAPLKYIKKKAQSLLIPYFLYNIFYILVNYIYLSYYNNIPADFFSIERLVINPFIHGHHLLFIIPAWFVPALFIIQSTYIVLNKYLSNRVHNMEVKLVIYLGLSLLAIAGSFKTNHSGIAIPIVRTLFGYFFYYLGQYYKEKLESKNIFNYKVATVFIVIEIALLLKLKVISYGLAFIYFNSFVPLAIITSIVGIYLCIYASKLLDKLWPSRNVLDIIGENTFSIMTNHFLVFLIMNIVILKIAGINAKEVNLSEYFYKGSILYLPMYLVAGVCVPAYVTVWVKKLIYKISDVKILFE